MRKKALPRRSLGLTKSWAAENLWNPFPSIRTTIQVLGSRESSRSNVRT